MNRTDFRAAKNVLEHGFDFVFVLEDDQSHMRQRVASMLRAVTGDDYGVALRKDALSARTNNVFSSSTSGIRVRESDAVTKSEASDAIAELAYAKRALNSSRFELEWRAKNIYDLELYVWAVAAFGSERNEQEATRV